MALPRERLVPLIVACGLFMENLDSTVLSTSLPSIARAFAVNPLQLNLAITGYLFSLAVFIPLSGWFADRFGGRVVFRAAIIVFMIGSICCGLSSSLAELVLARMLQGLGGAMMVPVGRLVVLRTVPKAQLVRAMAYLTVPALLGPVIGPPLGGFITTYFSWRWVFWINVPIGIMGVILVTRFIDNIREPDPGRLDLKGFAVAAIGLTGLIFGFETVGRDLLPATIVGALLAVGVLFLTAYVFYARVTPNPIIDLKLLRLRTFRTALIGGFLFRMGIGALPFLLPLLLQLGFDFTAFESGLTTFASAAGAMSMKFAAPRILERFGFRRVMIGSAILGGGSIGLCAGFSPTTSAAMMLAVLLVGGFFRSLNFTSVNAIAFADVDAPAMSRATTFSGTMQQLSLSMGVGTGALLLHFFVGATPAGQLDWHDFAGPFLVVAAIGIVSMGFYWRLPADAGAALTVHPRGTPARLRKALPDPAAIDK